MKVKLPNDYKLNNCGNYYTVSNYECHIKPYFKECYYMTINKHLQLFFLI